MHLESSQAFGTTRVFKILSYVQTMDRLILAQPVRRHIYSVGVPLRLDKDVGAILSSIILL